mgnify:CR=1 FL=1
MKVGLARGAVGRCALAAALGGLLQGCASIVGGTNQIVSVDTPGCPGARCELVNDKGRFFVPSTPGTVTVHRSYNNLQVTCTLAGATGAPISVASSTKAMAFGNILIGGVIGAGVDIGTGAAYDYPQTITVPMDCTSRPPQGAPGSRPRLGLQVDQGEGGVLVVGVEPGSPAAAAGLVVGDLIVAVDGVPVADPSALAARLAGIAPAAAALAVRRDGQERLVPLGPARDADHPPPAAGAPTPPSGPPTSGR